jgi:MFS family permease
VTTSIDTQPEARAPLSGVFLVLCTAQMIALLGNQTTGFGVSIWFYERTGSVSINAILIAATMLPPVVAAPIVGVLVDRWNRRAALLVGHAGAAVCAGLLFVIAGSSWRTSVPVVAGLIVAQSFMRSAELAIVSSSTAALVADGDRGRANGLVQLTFAVPQLVAPMLAPVLLPLADLRGLFGFEIASILLGIGLLVGFVRIPARGEASERNVSSMRAAQLLFGWRFVRERRPLLHLALLIAVLNFVIGCVGVLMTPLILGFAGKVELGFIASSAGVGMILGGVTMTLWGGPRRRIDGIIGGAVVQAAALALAAASRTPWVAALAGFVGFFVVPIMGGSNEAIWQRKVPASVQGRVFSFRVFLNGIAFALAYVSAGPLVDYAFAPAMEEGGWLAPIIGPLLGVGAERGTAVAFLLVAALPLLTVLVALALPPLRRVEEELPGTD